MNKYFITFYPHKEESYIAACNKAKEMGYTKWGNKYYNQFKKKGLLKMNEFGEYFPTHRKIEQLEKEGYTEIYLCKFKPGDKVKSKVDNKIYQVYMIKWASEIMLVTRGCTIYGRDTNNFELIDYEYDV